MADIEQMFRLIQSIPLAQSRAVQAVAGAVGARAVGGDRESAVGAGANEVLL